jgi:cell division transport system ATP-binding protein
MIAFEKVTKRYSNGAIVALEEITLSIQRREFISIVGQSGAGKTTFLKLIIGEEKPDEGRILIEDLDVTTLRRHELPYLRRRVGFIFQDMKLLPRRTVFENIGFAMEVNGMSDTNIKRDVPKLLELVGLANRGIAFPDELSGGERQRVAIARALAHKPALLLADEPTGNLDAINAWEILQLLLKINRLGTTVILATHAQELVNNIKRRVITLDKGRLALEQSTRGKYVL